MKKYLKKRKRKIENSEKLEISEKLFRVFLFPRKLLHYFFLSFCNHENYVAVIFLGNIYLSACPFIFTKRQPFFVWVLVFFVSTNLSIHSYVVHKGKNRKQLCYRKYWEVSIMLYYWFWYNKLQSRRFLIQLETTMQWLRKFEQKMICDEKF